MATKTFDITGDIQSHLRERFAPQNVKSQIVEPVEKIVTQRVKEFSANQKQITGRGMPALSRTYSNLKEDLTGSSKADLRFGFDDDGNRKPRAMDSLYSQVGSDGDKYVIGYGFDASANSPEETADEYMLKLQRGTYAAGGEKRKWFPEDRDASSPGVESITNDVNRIIKTHLRFGKTLVRNITLG